MQAQRGIGGIAPLILNFGAIWEWVGKATSTPIYPRDRVPVPNVEEAGWAPESVCMSLEKRKSLSSAKFESRTVQHVASRYTDKRCTGSQSLVTNAK
jgi:hypothetical protein